MSVTDGRFVQREQVSELADAEMSLHIFFVVNYATAERLLVSLSLKDLLLKSSR